MRLNTTINELLLNEEISQERIRNARILSTVRIISVSVFFLLHVIMGYGFNVPDFKGKEALFAIYLFIATAIARFSKVSRKLDAIRDYSISLIDIPLTFLLLNSWLPVLKEESSQHLVSLLGLGFMMFYVHISGLFFSQRIILPTSLAALAVVIHLFKITNTPTNTQLPGVLLLGLSGYSTYLMSVKVKKLVISAAHKQSLNEKLSRYFTPDVAAAIQSNKSDQENEQRTFELTVLFTDIRDFTRMSSTMTDSEVIGMLNEVHEHLVSCIFLTGGTLDKYLGDGVMAYFGAPVATADHADKAFECANMMRSEIQRLNEKRIARGEPAIQIGIGMHSGPAIVGDIGAEIRREFTIIGDTVNVASRIESLTKKHQVDLLLTSATREKLRNKHSLRSLGFDEIRGTQLKLETFTPAAQSV